MNIISLLPCLFISVIAVSAVASNTETTSPDDKGVTMNGADDVTFNGDPLVVDIVGKEIHDIYGKAIGDVDQVVKTITGKQAVIGLYYSLKEIALPLSDLHWKGDQLFVRLLEEDIDRMDDVDLGDARELEPGEYYRHEISRYEERVGIQ